MSSVAIHHSLSTFIDALSAGDRETLIRTAQEAIERAEDASELIGKVGLVAMRGDSDGHTVLTLGAAAMLCRWLIALRHALGEEGQEQTRGTDLAIQALLAAASAVKAGKDAPEKYPDPLFPGELSMDPAAVSAAMQKAIFARDTNMVERLLFGLFGTGADYRTIAIRLYDGMAQTFQEGGHTLLCAMRGSQVLDASEWGPNIPAYLHWLAPHLPLHTAEPSWIETVRAFLSEPRHSLESYRTRLAAPRNQNALPLRKLLLSEASTPQVCQAVYDALITNGASSPGIGSIIALAAADLLNAPGDDDHELFVRASHGLLYASATRLVYTQVQEVAALPLLFTAAAYINDLAKDLSSLTSQPKAPRPTGAGGGLIAPALLESLYAQITQRDVEGAMATARRYIQLGHNMHAFFAMIGLAAAQTNLAADQGHTLQIIQAAGDEYLAWPRDLASTNIEGFLRIALRAVAHAPRAS